MYSSNKRDTVSPSCSIARVGTAGSNGWYRSTTTMTINRNDATSGIAQYGLSRTSGTNYNGTGSLSQGNTTGATYYGYVKDNAGHTGSCTQSIKVDANSPTCSLTKTSSGTTSGVSATLRASDTGPSGLSSTTPQYKTGLTSSATYSVYDYAGNSGSCSVSVNSVGQSRWRSVTYCSSWREAYCSRYMYRYDNVKAVCPGGIELLLCLVPIIYIHLNHQRYRQLNQHLMKRLETIIHVVKEI